MSARHRVPAAGAALAVLSAGAVAAAGVSAVVRRYRRDLGAAWARLAAVDRRVVATPSGDIEYAERGAGDPVLVSHGIFHGCDGGLLETRDLVVGRRVIAPSRLGYLGSALPPGAAPPDQADAFVELLNRLGLDRVDVIGISAGATAARYLALRHPQRVKHLVVVSGNLPGGRTAVVPPAWARLLYADLPLWAVKVCFPRTMARLVGVPSQLPMTSEDERFVSEFVDSLFPITPRARGVIFDAFVSNAAVNDCDLEGIGVPTLLVHAKDDPLASYDSAPLAGGRIAGSVLVSIDSGGHLLLGQSRRVRAELAAFFAA